MLLLLFTKKRNGKRVSGAAVGDSSGLACGLFCDKRLYSVIRCIGRGKKGQIFIRKTYFYSGKVLVLNKRISESHATKFTFDDKLEFS